MIKHIIEIMKNATPIFVISDIFIFMKHIILLFNLMIIILFNLTLITILTTDTMFSETN